MGNKVVGIRADNEFFARAEKCAEMMGVSRNKFILLAVIACCDAVEGKKDNAGK